MNLQAENHRDRNEKCGKLFQTAIMLLLLFLFFIALFLAYEGVRYSYYSSKAYEQPIFELPDSALQHLLVFGGICLLAGIGFVFPWFWPKFPIYRNTVYKRFFQNGENVCRAALFLACVWMAAVGYFYLRGHPYYPAGDQINTTAGAAYARAGNFSMFAKGGYIGLYEQQKGLLFLYEILFALFGDFCYNIAEKIHLCFSIITLIAGYSFLKMVAPKPLYRVLYCLMMMFSMPYFIYLPYIYGDLPSICFSTVLFWALAAYAGNFQKRYFTVGCLMAALSLMVRTHTWIVLIAVGIGMVLLAMEKRTWRPVIAAVCILAVSWGSVKAVEKLYEYRSGFESGVGIPFILWIAMGMQETDGYPGVYNRYQQSTYEECGFEREPAIQVGREYISGRLREFRDNPAYARDFVLKKLRMQWLEPLFEGLYATETFEREIEEIPGWVQSLYYGRLHDIVWKFANYYQSLIYLAMLLFAAGSLARRGEYIAGSAGFIPLIAIVGGFLFSIIWESQCRYVLPYYMYMVVYASVGIGKAAEALGTFGSKFLGKALDEREEESDEMAA